MVWCDNCGADSGVTLKFVGSCLDDDDDRLVSVFLCSKCIQNKCFCIACYEIHENTACAFKGTNNRGRQIWLCRACDDKFDVCDTCFNVLGRGENCQTCRSCTGCGKKSDIVKEDISGLGEYIELCQHCFGAKA